MDAPVTHLRRIDLNLLVVFEAVVGEASVSRAARRLHLTQPALSHALARLREAFGDPILVRRGRTMEATPRALAALPDVRSLLVQAGRVFAHAGHFDPARAERRVQIGASDYAASTVLQRVLPQVLAQAPSMRLRVHHVGRADAPAQLLSGQLDLALGVFNTLTAELRTAPLTEEPYLCAVARGAKAPRKMTLADYLRSDHLNVLVQGDALGLIDEALAQLGLARRIVLTVPHFMAAARLLAGTPLLLTAPRGLLQDAAVRPLVRTFAPPLELPAFRTQMAWPQRNDDDEGLRWLRGLIQAAVA